MSTKAVDDLEFVVHSVATTIVANEKQFGDLDAAAGDGDLGYSLARGFEQVQADWDSFDRSGPAVFLQKVGATITKKIGGTSGPIWGTAFLRAAKVIDGKEEVEGADVVAMLRAAVEGIQARGKAELGDKTLLDALAPATDALESALGKGISGAEGASTFAEAARSAADGTAELQARRGRASYTGERSIGSPDAGAVAVAVICEDLASRWAER